MTTSTTHTAWGLHLADDAAHLVRLDHNGGGWRITDEVTFDSPKAVQLPPRCGSAEPLSVCIDDDATLYRHLAIPAADDAATGRMVAAQCETILPASGKLKFAHAWSRMNDDASGVWLAAMRADRLDEAYHKMKRSRVQVVPAASALVGAVEALGATGDAHVVIQVAHHHTLVVSVLGGRVEGCIPIEGGEVEAQSDAGGRAWLADIVDAVQNLAMPKRTGECLLICSDSVEAPITRAIPIRVRRLTDPQNTLAIGAAAAALLTHDTVPVFAGNDTGGEGTEVKQPAHWPKLIAAAGFVVLLLIVSAVMDIRQAAHLDAALADASVAEGENDSLQRQLLLARHLESLGPTPLTVLHDISSRAEVGIILSRWRMSPREGVRVGGTAPNVDALHQFFVALSKAPALKNVRIISQKVDAKKKSVTFEIETDLPKRFVSPSTKSAEVKP